MKRFIDESSCGATERSAGSVVIEPACELLPVERLWLWPQRIPAGQVTLLAGDPGVGKSLLAIDIAARVSSGAPWPDAPERQNQPGNVLFFSAEDDSRETIVPRLKLAGADLGRVSIAGGVYDDPLYRERVNKRRFELPRDLSGLGEALRDGHPVSLVVFDPITAYWGEAVPTGPAMHAMLGSLTEIASRYGTAILCVTHLRKGGSGKSVHRLAGSMALATAARAIWMVVEDSENKARRTVSAAKLNLAPPLDGLAFQVVDERVEWEREPVALTADAAFEAEMWAPKLRGASRWLREALSEGEQPARAMLQQAKECGISSGALHRAREKLNVNMRKEGFAAKGRWFWSLPAS